jgi:tRNA nucleotidyltransferase/poly(A) polymerase|tara:strand:- start:749 stop:925 length:177 start_codon:yes stop_codon:yes gene_type:complete
MNETQEVKKNREKVEIKKQLGRKYYKKFIQKVDDTDVLEVIMEQARAAPVKLSEGRDS